ncbi:MAG: hypothetical protein ACLR13_10495 [Acutalibacteraceae bacterium]
MKKRILSAALALTLLVSLNVQALATAPEEKVLLDSERFQDILNEYPDEFGYVEETYGVEITDYTAETSDLIKQAARDAYNTDDLIVYLSGRACVLSRTVNAKPSKCD